MPLGQRLLKIVFILMAVSGAVLGASPLLAQTSSYPSRPIHFIVAYPPGGPADLLSRSVAQKMSERLGQQVVVDNRPGAGGNIGAIQAAQAAPDGYTLFNMTSTHAANMTLYDKPGYNAVKDFAHITNVASYPLLLLVNAKVAAKNVHELIALAKASPGKLSYASAGTGGGAHIAGELFKAMAGVDIVHVPYKGQSPALVDTVGGQCDMTLAGVASAMPYVTAGRLRALGVSSARRLKSFPDIPTVAEAGVPGYEIASWLGVSAPAGTPAPIIQKLNSTIAAFAEDPDFSDRLVKEGAVIQVTSAERFTKFVDAEGVNVYDILDHDKLVVTKAAVPLIVDRAKKERPAKAD